MNPVRVAVVCLLVLCGWSLFPPTLPAQQKRLILNTNGPTAPVRALVFSQDSRRLYAAGLDKKVLVWNVAADGADVPQLQLVRSLHWEISRGPRGQIYAMDLNPQSPLLAFGGYCARGVGGDITLHVPGRDQLITVLPGEINAQNPNDTGHTETISSLSFSADGTRLVSGDISGNVWLWSGPEWQTPGRRIAGAATPPQKRMPRPVQFVSDDVLATALTFPDRPGRWYVGVYDAAQSRWRPTFGQVHVGGINSIVRGPRATALWATADGVGNIFVWDGVDAQRPRRIAGELQIVSMAFVSATRLAVCRLPGGATPSMLELFDLSSSSVIDRLELGRVASDDLAVSPNGRFLAAYKSDADQLLVCSLQDPNGRPLPRPLSTGPIQRVTGLGAAVRKVAFAADGSYRVGFHTGPLPAGDVKLKQAFDFGDTGLVPANAVPQQWLSYDTFSGGQNVRIDEDGLRLDVTRGNAMQCWIALNAPAQGRASCHCFVPDDQGRAWGLAVGTVGDNGVFVYELNAANRECRLVRYFRDHAGGVESIGVSRDGKYLVSSGLDQTIKVWSLEALQDQDLWTRWGAAFRREGNQLVVNSLLPQGIAARDFERGDVILGVRESAGEPLVTTPDGILAKLTEPALWSHLYFQVQRNGQTSAFVMTPGWEPLLTLFVDRRQEWAVWTPAGYYQASVRGDGLFGWLINGDERGGQPRYFTADQFRKDLERPDIIRGILTSGNLPDAVRIAGDSLPEETPKMVVRLSRELPEIEEMTPADNAQLDPNQPLAVSIRVKYPQNRRANEFVALAYVNSVPLGDATTEVDGQIVNYSWSTRPRAESNHVVVRLEERDRQTDSQFVEAVALVRAPLSEDSQRQTLARRRMFLIGIAAEEYGGAFPDLPYCIDDVEDLTTVFRERGVFQTGTDQTQLFTNREASRDKLESELSTLVRRLERDVQPEDLVVLMISGHGTRAGDEYFFVPPTVERNEDVPRQAIPWSLFEGIGELPCRKLCILDTCYSGRARELESLKRQQRGLQNRKMFVLCSSQANQESLEVPAFEHSSFTYYLLAALHGEADGFAVDPSQRDENGLVDLQEAAQFTEVKVAEFTARLQVPVSADLKEIEFANLQLTRK